MAVGAVKHGVGEDDLRSVVTEYNVLHRHRWQVAKLGNGVEIGRPGSNVICLAGWHPLGQFGSADHELMPFH